MGLLSEDETEAYMQISSPQAGLLPSLIFRHTIIRILLTQCSGVWGHPWLVSQRPTGRLGKHDYWNGHHQHHHQHHDDPILHNHHTQNLIVMQHSFLLADIFWRIWVSMRPRLLQQRRPWRPCGGRMCPKGDGSHHQFPHSICCQQLRLDNLEKIWGAFDISRMKSWRWQWHRTGARKGFIQIFVTAVSYTHLTLPTILIV